MCNKQILILLLVSTMYLSGCTGSSGKAQASSNAPPSGQNNTVALPPMPDPQINKATVAGVDSNKDGIRDDVEIWIAQTWPHGTPKYFAVRQTARGIQRDITEVDNINDSNKNEYMDLVSKDTECRFITMPDDAERLKMLNDVLKSTLNTSARIIADKESNHRVSGSVSIGYQGGSDPCEAE